MDIKKSFQILDVREEASEKEVRQAYRDMVSVWHPDRFSGKPRLKIKAEEKLKETNAAYETLRAFFSSRAAGSGSTEMPKGKTAQSARREDEKRGEVSRTELFAETGTEVVLSLWAHLSRKIGQVLSDNRKRE
jgi:DnaJ-class molecular chaperone